MHIAVAGNIGTGKTTLTELLSRYFGFEAHYEDNDQNPYLLDFYSDMQHWAFHLQVSFLHSRLHKVMEIHREKINVIQDRTMYEDAEIFAPNLHAMGLLSSRDYETYRRLYEAITPFIQPPDLLVYLRCDIGTLVEQIEAKGRSYENSIRFDYLKRLNERYDEWYDGYTYGKKIDIRIPEKQFSSDPEALGSIINRVKGEMFGLFSNLS